MAVRLEIIFRTFHRTGTLVRLGNASEYLKMSQKYSKFFPGSWKIWKVFVRMDRKK